MMLTPDICARVTTTSPLGMSPRMRELLVRAEGGVFVPTLVDFCPVNPDTHPQIAKKWLSRHSLEEFLTPAEAPAEAPAAERPKRNRRGKRSKKQGDALVKESQWRKMWQRCIAMVIKQNRHSRMQTALNRVESRRRALKREACAAAAAAKTERPYTQPGPSSQKKSGPNFMDAAPSVSEMSKAEGKKAIRLEARSQHEDALQALEDLRIAQESERKDNRKKAFLIGGS